MLSLFYNNNIIIVRRHGSGYRCLVRGDGTGNQTSPRPRLKDDLTEGDPNHYTTIFNLVYFSFLILFFTTTLLQRKKRSTALTLLNYSLYWLSLTGK